MRANVRTCLAVVSVSRSQLFGIVVHGQRCPTGGSQPGHPVPFPALFLLGPLAVAPRQECTQVCDPTLSSSAPPSLAVAPRCVALTSVASCRPTAHATPHNRPPQSCPGIEHTLTSLPLPPLHSRAQAFDTLTSMASVAAPLPSLLRPLPSPSSFLPPSQSCPGVEHTPPHLPPFTAVPKHSTPLPPWPQWPATAPLSRRCSSSGASWRVRT